MVAVNLRNRLPADVLLEQFAGTEDRKLEIGQSALIASFSRVTNDHGKDIDAEMIVVRMGQSGANQITPIAATQIENDWRIASKQLIPVDRPFRHRFQSGLGPFRAVEYLPGERDAELVFNTVWLLVRLAH